MSSTYLLIALDKHNGGDSPQSCRTQIQPMTAASVTWRRRFL